MERWGRWESDKKYLCLAKFQPPAVPLLFGPVLSCPILFYPVPFPQQSHLSSSVPLRHLQSPPADHLATGGPASRVPKSKKIYEHKQYSSK